jgi:hypothetical protein
VAPPSTIAVSVTSSPSIDGARPESFSARRTTVLTPPADSCLPDRLTQVTNWSGSSPSRSHSAVCSQAARSANSPSGRIRPVVSATGMKSPGMTSPRVGDCQRTSASTPTVIELSSEISGWKWSTNSPRWSAWRSSCSSPSSSPNSRAIS